MRVFVITSMVFGISSIKNMMKKGNLPHIGNLLYVLKTRVFLLDALET